MRGRLGLLAGGLVLTAMAVPAEVAEAGSYSRCYSGYAAPVYSAPVYTAPVYRTHHVSYAPAYYHAPVVVRHHGYHYHKPRYYHHRGHHHHHRRHYYRGHRHHHHHRRGFGFSIHGGRGYRGHRYGGLSFHVD